MMDKFQRNGINISKEDDALLAEAEDIQKGTPAAAPGAPAAGGGGGASDAERQAQIAANRARLQSAAKR